MARKTASRLAKRREAEAAEALDDDDEEEPKKKKKKATKKKAKARSRAKKDTLERRELIWAIYSSTMKEEARFKYTEKKQAEEKLDALRQKSKKTYFMASLKEPITTPLPVEEGEEEPKKKAVKKKAAATKKAATKKAVKKKAVKKKAVKKKAK